MMSKKNTTYGSKKRKFVTEKGIFSSKGEHLDPFENPKHDFSETDSLLLNSLYNLKKKSPNEEISIGATKVEVLKKIDSESKELSMTEFNPIFDDSKCEKLFKETNLNQKNEFSNQSAKSKISFDIEPEKLKSLESRASCKLYLEPEPKYLKDTHQLKNETRVTKLKRKKNLKVSFSEKPIMLDETKVEQHTEMIEEEQNTQASKKFNPLVNDSEKEAWFLVSDILNEKSEKSSQVLRNSTNISLTEEINSNPNSDSDSFSDNNPIGKKRTKSLNIADTNDLTSDEILDSDLTVCDDPGSFENNLISSQISQGFSNDFSMQESDIFSVFSNSPKFEKPKKDPNANYLVTKTYDSYRSYLTSEMVVWNNASEQTDNIMSNLESNWYSEGPPDTSSKPRNLGKKFKNAHSFNYVFDDLTKDKTLNTSRSALIDLCFKLVKGSIEENTSLLELYISSNALIFSQIENLIDSKDPLILFCLLSITYFLLSMRKFNIVKWIFGDKFLLIKSLIVQGFSYTTSGIIDIMDDHEFKGSRILKLLLLELLEAMFLKLNHFYLDLEQFSHGVNSLFFIFNITTGFERLTNHDPTYQSEDINELLILIYDEDIVLRLLKNCSRLLSTFPTEHKRVTTLDINYAFIISEAFLDLSIVETTEQIAQIGSVFKQSKKEMANIYRFAITFNDILQEQCFRIEDASKSENMNLLVDAYINFLQLLILISSVDNIARFELYFSNIDREIIRAPRIFSMLSFLYSIIEEEKKIEETIVAKLRISLLGFLFQVSTHSSYRCKFLDKANLDLLKKLFLSLEKFKKEQTILNSRAYICMIIGKILGVVEHEDLLSQVFTREDFEKMLFELKNLQSQLIKEAPRQQSIIIINQVEPILDALSERIIRN